MTAAMNLNRSSPEPDDAELVARIRLGDRAAEDRLYRRHGPQIASVCSRLLRSRREAEDALHDTFVRAMTQLHKLRSPERLKPWLLQIAVSQVRARLFSRRLWSLVGRDVPDDEQTLDATVDPGCSPDVRAELSLLDAVLRRAPAAARTAWVLRYVEGYSLDEVADALQCSLATAKRRIARADDDVRAHVKLEEVKP